MANIYLHYALDLWFEKRFLRLCRGKAYLIRFADDFVAAFEYPEEAMRFEWEVRKRLAEFNLEMAPEKTRRVPFGRRAPTHRQGKRCSFDFLGFKHLGGKDAKGNYVVIRIPTIKSCRKFLDNVRTWLRKNMHVNRVEQQKHLTKMLRGFYQYFGLHWCKEKLRLVRFCVVRMWVKFLRKQSQRHNYTWQNLNRRSWFKLPLPLVVHPNV